MPQTVAEIGGAVEVAVGDGFHDVVVEDVGDGAGDFEDAVVGSRAHVHAFHGVISTLALHLIDLEFVFRCLRGV